MRYNKVKLNSLFVLRWKARWKEINTSRRSISDHKRIPWNLFQRKTAQKPYPFFWGGTYMFSLREKKKRKRTPDRSQATYMYEPKLIFYPRYFELPISRTNFCFPWRFEKSGFHCTNIAYIWEYVTPSHPHPPLFFPGLQNTS